MKMIIKQATALLAILVWMTIPVLVEAQGIGGPGGGGGNGGNPDKPADVPFSGAMSWILIAAGMVLAVVVLRRMMEQKAATMQK